MTGFVVGLAIGWLSAFTFWFVVYVSTYEEDER